MLIYLQNVQFNETAPSIGVAGQLSSDAPQAAGRRGVSFNLSRFNLAGFAASLGLTVSMLSIVLSSSISYAPTSVPTVNAISRAVSPTMGFGKAELAGVRAPTLLRAPLAKEQNPVIGYFDPLGLADLDLWGQGEEASI
eukprot:1424986-Prymnesium_polylepis.1